MEATRRLEVEVPEELAQWVQEQVDAGRFENASNAVGCGLTAIREQDEDELEDWVREEIAAGYDEWKANPTGGIPIEEVSARLDEERKRRLEA